MFRVTRPSRGRDDATDVERCPAQSATDTTTLNHATNQKINDLSSRVHQVLNAFQGFNIWIDMIEK